MVRLLKSASAVERTHAATEFIDSFPPATELILVGASRDAVDDLVRGFVPESGATFGLHRFSLIQLAARLAIRKLAGAGIAPLSAVGAEALAARAAFEAISRDDLNYFAPIARFPGFARAAARTMAELRSGGIAPGRLQELQQSGPDNAALLHRFEEQMVAAALADQSLLFENALEAVRQGAEFARHPVVFLDVPLHSAIERAFVVALTCAAKQVLFTCPTGDLRTLENLKTIPGLEQLSSPSANHPSSLTRLGSYLFTESAPPEGKPDEEVVFSPPRVRRGNQLKSRAAFSRRQKRHSFRQIGSSSPGPRKLLASHRSRLASGRHSRLFCPRQPPPGSLWPRAAGVARLCG